MDDPSTAPQHRPQGRARRQWSLREFLGLVTIGMLGVALVVLLGRVRRAETELVRLRQEHGYLEPSTAEEIAASRAPSDQPLTYRARVRVPDQPRYRVCYSTWWPKNTSAPEWFAAVDLPPGESVVTVKIGSDPRDSQWKITATVQSERGTKRLATVLPAEHVTIFRGTHDALRLGIGNETVRAGTSSSIRLIDDRWLAGNAGVLLYGDKPPSENQVGVFAELQPDQGPI
ncbi:hypothetical protein Pla52o_08850 [Novipirellula galeiformis]|uniref:Uncharacterized protein n=1 Tax=Novipirellula galeiformis TaxID=2528004 RepID=A0A5C6CRM0_9BACT|nr:hypothetical protein [Novipirellula galeiformis]TWU27028.1 hypothetical protein Pla52o_08850 [Novipirellula galeiformis]